MRQSRCALTPGQRYCVRRELHLLFPLAGTRLKQTNGREERTVMSNGDRASLSDPVRQDLRLDHRTILHLHRLEERHSRTQLSTDNLDAILSLGLAELRKLVPPGLVLLDKLLRK